MHIISQANACAQRT